MQIRDILDIQTGIIIHQVNCKGVMGAGLAKAIRDKYPSHYADYRQMCSSATKSSDLLGHVIISRVTPLLSVVGFFAQDGYGRGGMYTDYVAFKSCIRELDSFLSREPVPAVYIPYGIGCGLGGGDWNKIRKLLPDYMTIVRRG